MKNILAPDQNPRFPTIFYLLFLFIFYLFPTQSKLSFLSHEKHVSSPPRFSLLLIIIFFFSLNSDNLFVPSHLHHLALPPPFLSFFFFTDNSLFPKEVNSTSTVIAFKKQFNSPNHYKFDFEFPGFFTFYRPSFPMATNCAHVTQLTYDKR